MKKLLIILFLSPLLSLANTYYVKAAGGDGSGLDDANAWSYAKLNATVLSAGDSVLFKRGDVFYGVLTVKSNANYGSYGSGANPKITGLYTLSSWTQSDDNIYYATLNVPFLNIVVMDGVLKGMARYPKTGYLTYTAHSGTTSITSGTTLPFNPTGAEIVIRKIRQIMDRQIITSVSGNTCTLAGAGAYGTPYMNNTAYQPNDGNGFFIQNSIDCLSQDGDWYYDVAAKRLYMYSSDGAPVNHTIQAAILPNLFDLNNKKYVTFHNIDFEGANAYANANGCSYVTFSGCNFSKIQTVLWSDSGADNITATGGRFTDILNNCFDISFGNNITIDGVAFSKIATIAGAGGSSDGKYIPISMSGNNFTVRNCTFNNLGFHGVVLYGNNTLIENNLFDTYCTVKDDGGAIYEFQVSGLTSSNKIIRNNTILNGIGAIAGAPSWEQYGQAAGIYLDANVNNVAVYGNTVAHGAWGGILLISVGLGNNIHDNIVSDWNKGGLLINVLESGLTRGITVRNNIFSGSAQALFVDLQINDNPALFGAFDNNRYNRNGSAQAITVNRPPYAGGTGETNMKLSEWKALYGLDSSSLSNPRMLIHNGKALYSEGAVLVKSD